MAGFSSDNRDPIGIALREDIGGGDITTVSFVPENQQASARIIARERAIVAGIDVAADVFRRVDASLRPEILRDDGAIVDSGESVLQVRGNARSILTAERVALNFLQRLSGIATLTHQFVEAVGDNRAKILDTRKTTPGLRKLEKAAVVAGGGESHRFGLYDMVLVKDNHLLARPNLSNIAETIRRLHQDRPDIKIELEADTLDQVRAFIGIEGVDIILLDNMSAPQMREAIALGQGKVKFEASGGVTLQNVGQIAATGVDYISIGALTHSARAIDFSLEMTHVAT
ncbi:MAG: carboxylating nicotinate-nucleotide diphosphorylase [Verrucomicrobiota bacterium]